MQYGILSRNEAMKKLLIRKDFSDTQVQDRRDKVIKLSNSINKSQHDLANLFFNPLNPTLAVAQANYGHDNIIIYTIDFLRVLNDDKLDVAFTDKNASVSEAKLGIYNDMEHIDKLNFDIILGPYWKKDRFGEEWTNWKQERSAEFMIYPHIPVKYIYNVLTTSPETKSHLEDEIKSYLLKLKTFKGIQVDEKIEVDKLSN